MTDTVFNVLICILALLVGILIGQTYRKLKQRQEAAKPKSLREAMGMKPSSSGRTTDTAQAAGTQKHTSVSAGKPAGGRAQKASGGSTQNASGGSAAGYDGKKS